MVLLGWVLIWDEEEGEAVVESSLIVACCSFFVFRFSSGELFMHRASVFFEICIAFGLGKENVKKISSAFDWDREFGMETLIPLIIRIVRVRIERGVVINMMLL